MVLQEIVESFLNYWKVRLGLSDWEFQLILTDSLETAGKVDYSKVAHRAIIKINPKVNSWLNKDDNLEFVILHELIHIVLDDIIKIECSEDELYFDAKERTINKLADAMIKAKYEDNYDNISEENSREE